MDKGSSGATRRVLNKGSSERLGGEGLLRKRDSCLGVPKLLWGGGHTLSPSYPPYPYEKNIYKKYKKVVDISSHPCYNNNIIENNTIK
ncbi:hypothetical protein phi18_030 [Bacillus phage phi18]|nr:hypothetical protein phi18_030 [Bacillus phage phi18]